MKSTENISIARDYSRHRKHKDESVHQQFLAFPASEELKKKLCDRLKAIHRLHYDSVNDFFWGMYRGIKVVETHLHQISCYAVDNYSEFYHVASDMELERALSK